MYVKQKATVSLRRLGVVIIQMQTCQLYRGAGGGGGLEKLRPASLLSLQRVLGPPRDTSWPKHALKSSRGEIQEVAPGNSVYKNE